MHSFKKKKNAKLNQKNVLSSQYFLDIFLILNTLKYFNVQFNDSNWQN